ncbi:MAG TPA: hypothetical protein VET85_05215 [Stellaceae bacterium]|nr:hypothetical protein [Stellaceae bacterium]
MSGSRIIVHSLDHALAAVAAAAALDAPVTLMSARAAGGYAGPLWFKALIEAAQSRHPAVGIVAILDCDNEPGTVLAAVRAGLRHVRFRGSEEMRERLSALAAATGCTVEGDQEMRVLDLLASRDPEADCRRFLTASASPD